MKLILLYVTLLLTSLSYCQNFTLQELIKLNEMSDDDFDTFVLSRGYKFHKTDKTEFDTQIHYVLDGKGADGKTTGRTFISMYRSLDGLRSVVYQTFKTEVYLKLKTSLKESGFTLLKSWTDEYGLYLTYKKGDKFIFLRSDKGVYDIASRNRFK